MTGVKGMREYKVIHSISYKKPINQSVYILDDSIKQGSIGTLYDIHTTKSTIYSTIAILGEIKISKSSYTNNTLEPYEQSNLYKECLNIIASSGFKEGYVRVTDGKDSYIAGVLNNEYRLGLLKAKNSIDVFTKIKSMLGR